jgi:hypothetical protein
MNEQANSAQEPHRRGRANDSPQVTGAPVARLRNMRVTTHRGGRTNTGIDSFLRWIGITSGGVLIFATAIYYTYKLKVAPLFAYSGLTYRPPNFMFYLLAILATILVALVLPRRIRRVSDFILWTLFVVGVAPSMLLAQYSKTLRPTDALVMALAIAGTMIMVSLLTRVAPRGRLPVKRLQKGIDFWAILLVFSGAIYTYLVMTTGMQLRLLSLTEVYKVRADFYLLSSGDVAVGYLLPVQANIVNPLFIARGIYSVRLAPLLMGTLGQVLIYSTTGHKSVLFSIVAMFGLAVAYRIYRQPPGITLLLALAAASSAAVIADRIAGSILWTSLISRRLMIVPGALTAAYVAVFRDKPKMNFVEVLPFTSNAYASRRPVYIVGAEFVGDPNTAANVNLFGHGYLNFGYTGMFIEGIVLVVLLALANAATRGLPIAISSLVFVGPALSLASASVFTTALTHGFFMAIFLSTIAPSRGWARKTRQTRARAPNRTRPEEQRSVRMTKL